MSDPATELPTPAAPPAPTDLRTAEIDEAWGDYRTWAMTSRHLKGKSEALRRWIVGMTFATILLGPAAQLLGLLSVPVTVTSLVTWLSSLFVTAVAFFNEKILGPEKDTPWLKARALAEKIKGETFRYVMKVPPYENPGEAALTIRVNQYVDALRSIAPIEISAEEKRNRRPADTLDADGYLEKRVRDQIDYFRTQRDANQQIVDRYNRLGWIFAGASALLVLPVPAAVTILQGVGIQQALALSAAVASGVSAFLVANLSAGRYRYLTDSYESARSHLDALRALWTTSSMPPEKVGRFVTSIEDTLAKENASWFEQFAPPSITAAAPASGSDRSDPA